MAKLIVKWVIFALMVMFVAWIIPGITVDSFWSAMVAAVVIVLVNIFIKPILKLLTLPINIATLGLFTIIINALLFMFVAYVVSGLSIENFLSAIGGSILLSILSIGISKD